MLLDKPLFLWAIEKTWQTVSHNQRVPSYHGNVAMSWPALKCEGCQMFTKTPQAARLNVAAFERISNEIGIPHVIYCNIFLDHQSA